MRKSEKREGERDRQTERERGGGGEREIKNEKKREREVGREGRGVEGDRERPRVSRGNYANKCSK